MSYPSYPLDDIYQMIYVFQADFGLWILLFAVIFGFVLSFAVGANDSANSWGTPVGAGKSVHSALLFTTTKCLVCRNCQFWRCRIVWGSDGDAGRPAPV